MDYINTEKDELFAAVSACGETLYYVTVNEPGDKPTPSDTSAGGFEDLDLYRSAMAETSKPRAVMLVQGNLVDEVTGKPLFGELSIVKNGHESNKGVLFTNKSDGAFTLVLTQGNNYDVTFEVPGYYPKQVPFNTKSLQDCKTEQETIKLKRWEGYYAISTLHPITNKPVNVDKILVAESPNNRPVTINQKEGGKYEAKVRGGSIYTINISGKGIKDTTYTFLPEVKDVSRQGFEDSVRISFEKPKLKVRVLEKETKQPIESAVLLVLNAKRSKTLFRGIMKEESVEVGLDFKGVYVTAGLAQNHFSAREILDMTKATRGGLFEIDLELVKLEPGAKLVTNNINFATNSAELTATSFAEIDQVIQVNETKPPIQPGNSCSY